MLWLVCCTAQLTHAMKEVRARDAGAQVLRTEDALAALKSLEGYAEGRLGIVLEHSLGVDAADLEPAIRVGAAHEGVREIMVLVERADPADAARLFLAGATEVIVTGGACAPDGAQDSDACASRGACAVSAESVPDGDGGTDDEKKGTSEKGPVREAKEGFRPEQAVRPIVQPREPDDGPRAPVVTAISGRGGVGKTTLIAAMACCAARAGLRAAVIDLDLMFGNMGELLGVEAPIDLGRLVPVDGAPVPERVDVEGCAMRIGPGLTLWGPLADPERAELMGDCCEALIGELRRLADVIFVDTSVFMGDAAAAAVACCDRCLVVGGAGASAVTSASRAMGLATRLGVPRTRMTGVLSRFGAQGCDEEFALRFEMGVALQSRSRIADGGAEVADRLTFGHMDAVVTGTGAFARSVRDLTLATLHELGCPMELSVQNDGEDRGRKHARLPWRRGAEANR